MSPRHFGYAEYLYAVLVCFGHYDVKTKKLSRRLFIPIFSCRTSLCEYCPVGITQVVADKGFKCRQCTNRSGLGLQWYQYKQDTVATTWPCVRLPLDQGAPFTFRGLSVIAGSCQRDSTAIGATDIQLVNWWVRTYIGQPRKHINYCRVRKTRGHNYNTFSLNLRDYK